MIDDMNIQTLKGFRDFLPEEAKKRQYAINILKQVFESYGFEPLETPSLEYEEVLLGKYGDEGDKLMYRFEDNGKRKVALRYDQTVPLARVVAQYAPRGDAGQNELPMPFKRYQIQNVWRAENTQKGRFREFLQCDIDTVGTSSPLADAEIVEIAARCIEKLGFTKYKIIVNDRSVFDDISKTAISSIDKLKKIGKDKVLEELIEKGISKNKVASILSSIEGKKLPERLKQVFNNLKILGLGDSMFEFSPTLARGLDYYTGMIFEIEIEGYSAGSVCGGGRYDNLIGMFTNKRVPAVGCAFGFDRLVEAVEELNLFPKDLQTTKVLVTIFPASPASPNRGEPQGGSKELRQQAIDCSLLLRSSGVPTELYLDENAKMEKQLKYADRKGIPFVVIIGPDEAAKNTVILKNMNTRAQETLTQKDLLDKLV